LLIVATLVEEDVQVTKVVTSRVLPSLKVTVALNCRAAFAGIDAPMGAIEIEVGD
jgi:hypothetical protein